MPFAHQVILRDIGVPSTISSPRAAHAPTIWTHRISLIDLFVPQAPRRLNQSHQPSIIPALLASTHHCTRQKQHGPQGQ